MKSQLSGSILERRKDRAEKIVKKLKKLFPNTKMTLNYSNNWELLVSVVLSAQCTDKKVNEVTEKLFKKYKKLDDYVKANIKEFEQDIKPTGFYRQKAKNILTTALIVKEKYSGRLPKTMEEMVALPGVARKTANVVLGNAFSIVLGIAVDTHVKRLSKRLGLTTETSPEKIEKDLMQIIPKKEWFEFTYRLIDYGRKYCSAKNHDHGSCPLNEFG